MTATTDWQAKAEQYLAERNAARLEAQRDVGEAMRKLREQRDRASSLFDNIATKHARLAAWAREALPEDLQSQFFGILANGSPDWKTTPRNLAVDLLAMTAEADALRRERDELASGMQALRARLAEELAEDIIEAQRAQIRTLTAERDAAQVELAQARGVLQNMEWDSWGYDRFGEGRAHCPCCGCTKDEGHAPDCALSAALAAKGE